MSATVYSENGICITQGLQPASVCDVAINAARRIAASREENVILEDDDGYWVVSPDGTAQSVTAEEIGF